MRALVVTLTACTMISDGDVDGKFGGDDSGKIDSADAPSESDSGNGAPSPASLADAVQYTGENEYDLAGRAVSGAGDVNGDGFDDLLIGAHGNADGGANAGAAYLVLGSASPSDDRLSNAVEFAGEREGDSAGMSVADAGDIDGDGFDDFLVGASSNADGGVNAGAAYLVLGRRTMTSASLASAVEYTGGPGDSAGRAVAAAGDVNGDGAHDLVVGASSSSGTEVNAGAAYLVLGSGTPVGADLAAAVSYRGEVESANAGTSVSGAGDVNGDGLDDILVGAPNDAGAAYLILGQDLPSSMNLAAAVKYSGERSGDYAGFCVSGAGDVDGDGYRDIVVGAYGNDDAGGSYAGAAYLVLGSDSPSSASLGGAVEYTGELPGDYAGYAVADAGDVDRDGYGDLLVSGYLNADGGVGAGAAYLVLGSNAPASGSLAKAVEYSGETAGQAAGHAVSSAGDVNADGDGDLLVGVWTSSDGGWANAGAAYLILGGR